ncbi:DUF1000-domain-containing protein [Stereum hirsutum FP-91666 SS1]|uniref:DUF1000-domain-containing protein n=1 Tax=Stereum hirsutum (strain FP-91666) TaxID=721885 RepID=UPI000444A935|nr:DUF1000-domain-containing protein [Stereum hirsutum FP-91666 SS1]EIM82521.1 DUF1000-domain-containing protein [Stereum hirsutum FP-91666 SS1]
MAPIKEIHSKAELDALLEAKKTGLTVIDFHAQWCGTLRSSRFSLLWTSRSLRLSLFASFLRPCHAIAPRFTQLSQRYSDVAFARVDVDQVQPVAQQYSVTAMPTFLFIKNKAVVDTLRGADPSGLESRIRTHSQSSDSGGAGASSSGSGTVGETSLLEHLDLKQLNCLNEADGHTLKDILGNRRKNTTGAYLLSDADEQLLLSIEFNQTVRIRSILIKSSSASQAPKLVKILVNKTAISFDDVEDAQEPEVAQILELTPEQVAGEGQAVPLRFVRFQNVNSIHIFVASNQGGEDETRIDAVDVFGSTTGTTRDLSGLKRQEDD